MTGDRLDRAFREEWTVLVATLARRFGDLQAAEDATGEAFAAAARAWARGGVPPNPGAWLNLTASRKAIDQLATMQLNARGERTRLMLDSLTDAEQARELVGQVAVPFGICREPTNVKAGGQDCPFRHQCFGCVHFRTDPSFLPELRQHLDRLLTDRERLLTAARKMEREPAILGASAHIMAIGRK